MLRWLKSENDASDSEMVSFEHRPKSILRTCMMFGNPILFRIIHYIIRVSRTF